MDWARQRAGNPLLDVLDRILAAAAHLLLAVGAIVIALMAVHVMADVSSRYLFNAPLPGTIEVVSLYYMVAVIYLPLAYVQSRRQHIVVVQFTDWLPERARRFIDAMVGLLGTAVLFLLTWRGTMEAIRATEVGQQSIAGTYAITSWPPRWFVPFGLAVMALYTITQSVRDLVAALSGHLAAAVPPNPHEDI
jgi:TRAP-type C4-dicarboxylate transport system permease small subunit